MYEKMSAVEEEANQLYDQLEMQYLAKHIVNRKAVLSKYAANNGFSNPVFFIDDGVSGASDSS